MSGIQRTGSAGTKVSSPEKGTAARGGRKSTGSPTELALDQMLEARARLEKEGTRAAKLSGPARAIVQGTLATQMAASDIGMTQIILRSARERLEAAPPEVKAKASALARQNPIPSSPQALFDRLMECFNVPGLKAMPAERREIVRRAVDHVSNNRGAYPEVFTPLFGAEEQTPDAHVTQIALTNDGVGHILFCGVDLPISLEGAGFWHHFERINRTDIHGRFSPDTVPYGAPSPLFVALGGLLFDQISVYAGQPYEDESALPVSRQRLDKEGKPTSAAGDRDTPSIATQNNPNQMVHHMAAFNRAMFVNPAVGEVKWEMRGRSEEEIVELMTRVYLETRPREHQLISMAFNIDDAYKALMGGERSLIGPDPTPEDRALILELGLKTNAIAARVRAQVETGLNEEREIELKGYVDRQKSGEDVEIPQRLFEACKVSVKATLDTSRPEPGPSFPTVEVAGTAVLMEWALDAYRNRVATYSSGGMGEPHFHFLPWTLLRGVGIGGYFHAKTDVEGVAGPLLTDKFVATRKAGDAADRTLAGKVAYVLRQLAEREATTAQGQLPDLENALLNDCADKVRSFCVEFDTEMDGLKVKRDAKKMTKDEFLAALSKKADQLSADDAEGSMQKLLDRAEAMGLKLEAPTPRYES